ncbi:MAG: exopolysaccharide biosynthesis polyprenyl glycosylphosphotransferase [Actinomycetota bacterium]|nr:exopolysaccharide biosynthesis polyprenyl glycosylphosphotransferase [Actinomycetota bacterium]
MAQRQRSHRPTRTPRAAPADLPLLTRLNERGFRLVQIADAVAVFAILVATNLVRFGWETWDPGPGATYDRGDYLVSFAVAAVIHVSVYYFGGLYEREPRLGFPPALPRAVPLTVVAVLLIGLVVMATSGAGVRVLPFPTINLGVLAVLGSVAVAANRRAVHLLRLNRQGPPRVLLVGAPDEVNVARQHIRDANHAQLVGSTSTTEDLLEQVERHRATDVVLLSGRWLDSLYPTLLNRLERKGVTVLQRVTAKDTLFGLQGVREVGGMPFVLLRNQTLPVSRARFKRVFELILLAALSPVLLAVLGAVAAYQLVVVGRPILFWQERVGKDGRPFQMVKFRTMHPSAEEDGAPRLATYDDPRIISACRWVRAMRLDELPQLWNILRGEMSLVGPRPERPLLTAQFEEIIPGYTRRYEIPPGITGLAQVHGRYDTDPEYKLGYDLQYLVNWSPVLDLEILLRTVLVVITRRI